MKPARRQFDPQAFLAKVGIGKTILTYRKTILTYRKGRIIYVQGEEADKIFYIQSGKVKVTVDPSKAKRPSSAFWKLGSFLARDVCMARRCASEPRGQWRSALSPR